MFVLMKLNDYVSFLFSPVIIKIKISGCFFQNLY